MEIELIATCWTTSGKSLPQAGYDKSSFSLQSRMEIASGLGWQGFGILHTDLMSEVERIGLNGVRKMVVDCGFKYIELELISDWYADGIRREKSDRVRKELLEAASELGALHVKVGSEVGDSKWPWNKLTEELFTLAEEAHAVGTRIAIEPLPFAQIHSMEEGVKLVDAVSHSSLGLLIDIWHVVHGRTKYNWLESLSKRYIFGIELNDALLTVERDLFYDTIHNRKYCGEGEFRVVEFIKAILKTGYSGPFGVEILSDFHRTLDLTTALTIAKKTTLDQFALATA